MGNGIIGGVHSGLAALTPRGHPARALMKDRAKHHLEAAKHQASGALIGELQVTAHINGDISKPYNIALGDVNTDFKITRGVGGWVVHPLLALVKSDLKHIANRIIEVKLGEVFEKLRVQIQNLRFIQDDELNGCIQQVWEPQNISAMFTNDDGLRLTLNSEFVTWIIEQVVRTGINIPNQVIQTKLDWQNVQYPVHVTMDVQGRNVFAVMYGMGGLLSVLNEELRFALKSKIGKECHYCSTQTSKSTTTLSVDAKIKLRVHF